jgi:hypothetical protein
LNPLRSIIFLITFTGIIFVHCAKNPFSTRATEPPLGSGGTWETPQLPEIVVQNLRSAYNEQFISNYELCFSDSFLFSAPEDSIDAISHGRPELFVNWNKAVEIGTATNIFSTFSGSDTLSLFLNLTRSSELNDLIEDSAAVLYRDYDLRIISGQAGQTDTITAIGHATFHLAQEQLNWWIIRGWEDRPDVSGEYDWGDFKAEYRR